MNIPEIPPVVVWTLCIIALAVGARFRLNALLRAGATRPGPRRISRTLWVVGLDLAAFAGACVLLRLGPFPALMSGLVNFGLTAGLLWAQWFFRRERDRRSTAGASALLRDGMQGVQVAAMLAGYNQVEERVRQEFHRSRWRLGIMYQAVMVGLCVGLRVLDTLQGGWLYFLFSLIWQAAVTGILYWMVDHRRAVAARARREAAKAAGGTTAGGVSSSSPTINLPRGMKMPFNVRWRRPVAAARHQAPGSPRQGTAAGSPAAGSPAAGSPAQRAAGPSQGTTPSSPPPSKRKFALRSDVQATVAFTAGIWCGVFARVLGFWYGFASVTAFRTLLSLASPLTSGLISKYIPQALQGYFLPPARPARWTVQYFRSAEFWYGPGMGVVGGIVGGVIRHVLIGR